MERHDHVLTAIDVVMVFRLIHEGQPVGTVRSARAGAVQTIELQARDIGFTHVFERPIVVSRVADGELKGPERGQGRAV